MGMKEEAEGALIEKGLDEGLLSYPSRDSFVFSHRMVPESVGFEGTSCDHITSFPDAWLPDGVQIVQSPVFAVDSETGDVAQPNDSKWNDPDYSDRLDVKRVKARKIGDRDHDLHPYLEESEKRETMIRSALDTFVQGGFKYFFCIMEFRPAMPGGLLYNKVSIFVRGA